MLSNGLESRNTVLGEIDGEKKPKVEAPAHAVVCTRCQNAPEQPQDNAYWEYVEKPPVYRLGIECECSCKDCQEILLSFHDNCY